ncbi:guanine nucleotide exchange factor for Rab-3A isoform X2 [Magallana gigas]|uniref:guanine nucleotide exchange factor for Rab-3A isoform X2 n=1 Tax=Magallana gigas TaxID=29159 RepID=UPI00333E551F
MAGHFPSGASDKSALLHDQNMNNNSPSKQIPSPGGKEPPVFILSSPQAIPSPISGSPVLKHNPITPPLLQKIQSTSPQKSPSIPHKNFIPPGQGQSCVPLTAPVNADSKLVAPISNGGQKTSSKPLENVQRQPAVIQTNPKTEKPKSLDLRTQDDNYNQDSSGNMALQQLKGAALPTEMQQKSAALPTEMQQKSAALPTEMQHKNVALPTERNGGSVVKEEGSDSTSDSERRPDLSKYRIRRGLTFCTDPEEGDNDTGPVELRHHRRGELRHAMSEVLPNEVRLRKRSQTMANVKEHAYGRLQEELSKAQEELKLKDEECEKLLKVRDQMCEELEELTASLFEEANNMVQDANIKRMHSEKRLIEAQQQIEVLQAEVVALKQLVLTSTPSSPNKHLHPQIAATMSTEKEKPKSSKPFWKTHRRSTSHHEFTKEARQEVEAQQEAKADRCKEIDSTIYEEFVEWRRTPSLELSTAFLNRMYVEDIGPCLNFSNVALAEKVKSCVASNSLTIEPIPGDSSYPRRCRLTENNKLCNYKIKLGENSDWYSISQLCRNRIAAVCDFYTYIRYIYQGLVKSEDKEAFYEIVRLRKKMALSRLGYS